MIPDDVILTWINAYQEGTIWVPPPVCAVCGQAKKIELSNIDISNVESE